MTCQNKGYSVSCKHVTARSATVNGGSTGTVAKWWQFLHRAIAGTSHGNDRHKAMASIYKRGKNWWIHCLVSGKSVSKSLKTTSERIALEKKQQLEVLGGNKYLRGHLWLGPQALDSGVNSALRQLLVGQAGPLNSGMDYSPTSRCPSLLPCLQRRS